MTESDKLLIEMCSTMHREPSGRAGIDNLDTAAIRSRDGGETHTPPLYAVKIPAPVTT